MIVSFGFIAGVALGIEFPPVDEDDTYPFQAVCILDLFIIRIVFEKVKE